MRWNNLESAGWGRVLHATSQTSRPEKLSSLTATEAAPAVGNRRSYGDACLNDGGRVIDMTRLDRFLDFNPETGVLHVEAGLTIGQIATTMAPRGWLPAVMPGTGFATVGGAIAMDVHGKNHHIHGSFGQHLQSITLFSKGKLRRITPDRPARLFRATVGGLGQTGVIVSAELKLMRCKGDVVMVTERRATDFDDFIRLLNQSEATYTVGWIDATARGEHLGRGILEEAETGAGLVPPAKPSKSVPFNAPAFALSSPIVRLFNSAYFRRVPKRGRTVVKPISEFFFPLDRIHDWNRLYGKKGFHQFQCVVPMNQAGVLKTMLAQISESGLASPLAVLKRMGEGRGGFLSFPMAGYTLACDLRAGPETEALVHALQDAAAKAGGRIYLAKDALAAGESVRAMYPEHADWASEAAKADPEGALTTSLVRRLGLRNMA
jgi:decaprenylphospho-beta-D-ribofuranose 2-oxidase